MSGVSSVGSSSIDVYSIVSQLMQIESRRKTILEQKETAYELKLSSVGTLSSAMSSFNSAMDNLKEISSFQAMKTTVGDSSVFTASASSTATTGTYNLEVTQLAKANMLTSSAYSDTTSAIATGTLTIQVGTGTAKDITIDSSNNTLTGIKDAINNAGSDVSASIINDGTGYKLLLTANNMGASNTIKVTVTGDSDGNNTNAAGLSNLVYDPAGTKNMTEIQQAKSSIVTMGTLTVTKDSNTITDFIPGVTLNLLKEQVGTPVSLSVSTDTSTVSTNVNKFVSEFNKLMKTIKELSGYNTTTKKNGPLGNDGILRQVESELRRIIGDEVPGISSEINTLSEIGITTERDGTLSLDTTKLDEAMENNFDDIAKLFVNMGAATDPGITIVSSGPNTLGGTYAINLTQAASKGTFAGGSKVNNLNINTSRDNLDISINGIAGSISITTGSYASGTALASEIQTKINSASVFTSAGITATVTYDVATEKLTITSDIYGASSTVGSISGDAANNLGLNTGTSTAGSDVAGTIGGYAATGSGQTLTANSGTPLEGLVLQITGSAIGDRGSFAYSTGVAESIYNRMTTWLDSTDGIIASKTENINDSIKTVNASIYIEELRLEGIEKRLTAQFTALQTALDQLQGISSFLSSQAVSLENLIKE